MFIAGALLCCGEGVKWVLIWIPDYWMLKVFVALQISVDQFLGDVLVDLWIGLFFNFNDYHI